MYNIKEVKKEATKIQNNLSTFIIMSLTLIIGILYMNRLFCLLKVEELQYMNVISFIRLFNLVLAGLAIGSCIMCYNSTKIRLCRRRICGCFGNRPRYCYGWLWCDRGEKRPLPGAALWCDFYSGGTDAVQPAVHDFP